MKRLFKVQTPNGTPEYFEDKMEAKKMLRQLVEIGQVAYLRRGPDHWKGETE